MLGRQVGSSLLRLPIRSRLVLRPTAPFQSSCPQDLALRTFSVSSQRQDTTNTRKPGRPRKAVGEPSRPVKRAAKRQARSATTDDAATELVKSRKPAARRKTTTKTKKAAAPKKPVKKVLTEKQKEAKAVKLEKQKIKELKAQALNAPKIGKAMGAFNAFVKEKSEGRKGQRAILYMKEYGQEWKAITPAQHEHYNHLAHQANEAAQAELKRWVESHSPEEIKQANRARAALVKKLAPKSGKLDQRYKHIPDERIPKHPATSYILFAKNRQESGDFKNIPVVERAKLIGKEWQALTTGEKKKYKDLQQEDLSRYSTEYKDAYGYMPPSVNGGLQSASAAA